MTRANVRQADMERLIRAAERQGAALQIDMRTLVATVIPAIHKPKTVDGLAKIGGILNPGEFPPDGKDVFDEN